jgi:hypothetical protein
MDEQKAESPPDTTTTQPDAEKVAALMKRLFAPVTNASRATRLSKALFGPMGRVWQRDGQCQIGEENGGALVYGAGTTWAEAFLDATADLPPDRISEILGSELRGMFSLDARQKARRAGLQ